MKCVRTFIHIREKKKKPYQVHEETQTFQTMGILHIVA